MSNIEYSMVLVEWLDSCGEGGNWITLDACRNMKPTLIRTCGYLICHEEDYITIASSIDQLGEFVNEVTVIPRFAIVGKIHNLSQDEVSDEI